MAALKLIYPILVNGISKEKSILDNLQVASNLAGRAINITTTTSAHALSYNLTKLFGIPHGMAVNMTLPIIWKLHNQKIEHFDEIMTEILNVTNVKTNNELIDITTNILEHLNVWRNVEYTKNDIDFLVDNVNLERLGNNPYPLQKEEIRQIYIEALNKSKK